MTAIFSHNYLSGFGSGLLGFVRGNLAGIVVVVIRLFLGSFRLS